MQGGGPCNGLLQGAEPVHQTDAGGRACASDGETPKAQPARSRKQPKQKHSTEEKKCEAGRRVGSGGGLRDSVCVCVVCVCVVCDGTRPCSWPLNSSRLKGEWGWGVRVFT